jgi:hypothetical protein
MTAFYDDAVQSRRQPGYFVFNDVFSITRLYSSLCVQTGSGAHPASSSMGTGVLSPGVKRGQLTTHPHLVQRSRMSRSCTCSPPSASVECSETALAFRLHSVDYTIVSDS